MSGKSNVIRDHLGEPGALIPPSMGYMLHLKIQNFELWPLIIGRRDISRNWKWNTRDLLNEPCRFLSIGLIGPPD